jgi:hypothetical protein
MADLFAGLLAAAGLVLMIMGISGTYTVLSSIGLKLPGAPDNATQVGSGSTSGGIFIPNPAGGTVTL